MLSSVRRALAALAAFALVAGSALVASSAQASAGGWIAAPSDGLTVGTSGLHVTGVLPSVFDHSYWWVDSGAATTISAGSSVDPVPFDFAISGLAPGEHRLNVSQGPGEGTDYVDFVVDPPPSIVITEPTTTISVLVGTPIPFSATITDSNFASWTLIGSPPLSLSGTEGNLSVTLDTTGWNPGANLVYLTATDAYGSASIAQFLVSIEYPPTPTPPLPPPPPTPTPPIIPNNTFPPPNPSTPPTNPNPPTDPTPASTPTPTPSTSPSVSKPTTTLASSDDTEAAAAAASSEPTVEPTEEVAGDPSAEPTIETEAADAGDSGIPVGWIFGGFALVLALVLGLLARFLVRRRA